MQDMAGRPSASGSTAAASEFSATTSSTSVSQFNTQSYWDSDFETEPDPPDWRLAIHQEELNKLNPRERKRQDVINGTYILQFLYSRVSNNSTYLRLIQRRHSIWLSSIPIGTKSHQFNKIKLSFFASNMKSSFPLCLLNRCCMVIRYSREEGRDVTIILVRQTV